MTGKLSNSLIRMTECGRPLEVPNPRYGEQSIVECLSALHEMLNRATLLALRDELDPSIMHDHFADIRGMAFSGLLACNSMRRATSPNPSPVSGRGGTGSGASRTRPPRPSLSTLEDLLK